MRSRRSAGIGPAKSKERPTRSPTSNFTNARPAGRESSTARRCGELRPTPRRRSPTLWRDPRDGRSAFHMDEIVVLVCEPPEGGDAAEALGRAIVTTAGTLEDLNRMVRDAVVCHFDEVPARDGKSTFAYVEQYA